MTLLDTLIRSHNSHNTELKPVESSSAVQLELKANVPFINESTWKQAHKDNEQFDGIRGVNSSYQKHPDEFGSFGQMVVFFIGAIVWGIIGCLLGIFWFFPGSIICGTILLRTATMYTLASWLALFNGVPPPSRDRLDYWIEMWPRGLKIIKDTCFKDNPHPGPLVRPPITPGEAIRETVLAIVFWGGAISMTIMMQFVLQIVGYVYHYFFG